MAFESIASNYYANTSQSQRSLYSTDWNGFAILRTLARKAAEAGGCPVVKIDEIAQESIQKLPPQEPDLNWIRFKKIC